METTASALKLAHEARKHAWTMSAFQDALIASLAKDMARVNELGLAMEAETGFSYLGLDGSFAPFPDGETSVAKLIELLGPWQSQRIEIWHAGMLGRYFSSQSGGISGIP